MIKNLTPQVIKAAIQGNEDAMSQVLKHYDLYIDALSAVKSIDLSGKEISASDQDIKSQLQQQLVQGILKWKEMI